MAFPWLYRHIMFKCPRIDIANRECYAKKFLQED